MVLEEKIPDHVSLLKHTNKVLIIDDEWKDVEALTNHLSTHSIEYVYCSGLETGIEAILEEALGGDAYGAIILDNHFRELYVPETFQGPNFDGIDLAQIILGRDDAVAEELFGRYAGPIQEAYRDRIILFSGSAESDAQHRPELFKGLTPVTKRPDDFDDCCEVRVLYLLNDLGFGTGPDEKELFDYKSENGLHRW